MNFSKLFVLVVLILALSIGQSEAGFLKKIGKKIVSKFFALRMLDSFFL